MDVDEIVLFDPIITVELAQPNRDTEYNGNEKTKGKHVKKRTPPSCKFDSFIHR